MCSLGLITDRRFFGAQQLADEAEQVIHCLLSNRFVVRAIHVYPRHILYTRLVSNGPLPHFVEEFHAFRSSAASVQHAPVGADFLRTGLARLGRIRMAKHAGDEVQELFGRMHVLDSARLHLVDVALPRAVLAGEDDRAVDLLHAGVSEGEYVHVQILLQPAVRRPQLVKDEAVASGTQTFVVQSDINTIFNLQWLPP